MSKFFKIVSKQFYRSSRGVRKGASLLVRKISLWPIQAKIIACVTAGCLVLGSIFGAVWFNMKNTESEPEEILVEEEIIEEEPEEEVVEEIVLEEEEEEEPEYLEVDTTGYEIIKMTYTSIEKDMDLYFVGSDGKKVSGHTFSVKMVSTSDAKSLSSYISAITAAREAVSSYEEENAEALEQATEEIAAEYEELTDAVEAAIKEYSAALDSISGTIYVDNNQNGAICEEDLTAGDFVVCYVPVDNVLASNMTMDVNIKAKIEYTVVDVVQKTVEYTVEDDAQAEEAVIEVEEVAEDTVEHVESKVIEVDATYKKSTTSVADLVAGDNGVILIDPSQADEFSATIYSSTIANELLIEMAEGYSFVSATSSKETVASVSGNVITAGDISSTKTANITITYTCDNEEEADTSTGEEEDATADESEDTEEEDTDVDSDEDESSTDTVDETTESFVNGIGTNSLDDSESTDDEETDQSDLTGSILKRIANAFKVCALRINSFVSGLSLKAHAKTTHTITLTVTVIGADTELTDSEGNTLYLDKNGTVATVGTYSANASYYSVDEASYNIYYGWQIIDGTRYYYDANGNIVTGEQVIDGVTYKFGSDGALMTSGTGIDVSKWQGTITWSKVVTTASFAIIRCGYRGSSTHGLAEDPMCRTNVKNAKAAGVMVGLYFYSLALSEKEAVEEASFAVAIANEMGGITYPIFIDMEDSSQLGLTNAERDAIVTAFCKTVQNAGYQAGVYANKNWLTNYLTPSTYSSSIYVWCAQYNTECTYSGRYELWQYTSTGTVPGISGNVDMNTSYFGY